MREIKRPRIILATHNKHKAEEIAAMLKNKYDVKTMADFGITGEIIEDGETIEENADIKVNQLSFLLDPKIKSESILMADDTGLFVDYLNGEPGVYSARYSGENATYESNNEKLLKALEGVHGDDRSAYFSTSLAMITPEDQHCNFTSKIEGYIAEENTGSEGFGYDPVFIEKTTKKTYAQMDPEEKNRLSHRAKAVREAESFLENWFEEYSS